MRFHASHEAEFDILDHVLSVLVDTFALIGDLQLQRHHYGMVFEVAQTISLHRMTPSLILQ